MGVYQSMFTYNEFINHIEENKSSYGEDFLKLIKILPPKVKYKNDVLIFQLDQTFFSYDGGSTNYKIVYQGNEYFFQQKSFWSIEEAISNLFKEYVRFNREEPFFQEEGDKT
jgi:hypothetical protein